MRDVAKLIGMTDRLDKFNADEYPYDAQGWGGHMEFFSRMIELAHPQLVIEVGSWKGKSAIAMADALDEQRFDETQVLCIDTWLGATEFVDKPDLDPKRGLQRLNGFPQVYYQFLANVSKSGHRDTIVPFPQTSTNAARFLKKQGVTADLIYVDASHEYEDVTQDLRSYMPLLTDGGIIFGDDYCEYWRGVVDAVDEHFSFLEIEYPGKYRFHHRRMDNASGEAPSDYWAITRREVDL